jgi:DNA invertase Pin-like site-specific DNA recombinase
MRDGGLYVAKQSRDSHHVIGRWKSHLLRQGANLASTAAASSVARTISASAPAAIRVRPIPSFDLSTASGKLMRTIMAGLAEFERDLIHERVTDCDQSATHPRAKWVASNGQQM